MTTIFQNTFAGSGAAPAPLVKVAGSDATQTSGSLVPADLTVRTVYKLDAAATTVPAVIESIQYISNTGGYEALLVIGWQPDNTKLVAYLSTSACELFLHTGTDFSTNYTAVAGGTSLLTLTHVPGQIQFRATQQADHSIRIDLWNAVSVGDLGTGLSQLINNFVIPAAGHPIRAPGVAGIGVKYGWWGELTYSDASVSPSGLATGNAVLDLIASGAASSVLPGSIVTLPFSRNPGNGARPVSLANNAIAVLTDDPNLARLAGANGLTMDGSGRLTLSGAIPVPAGTSVIVVTREADGKLGVERYTVS